ncbi:DapH/DapD/GlmU-related protein [Novosphingobium resinovorum]|uniref:acyltransferase n=1 Tax=Novosphingobium TaxID=165696 RepID=UPI001B3C5454|nr:MULTISPECIES: acyltransferase [Novosphingobium]MBF7012792.1 acyltransferase [Novosphingobium sp. HR1a]WJM27527.1 DapH/DapD/GlmU-related protein [Novosphingobium resinovorum]
MNPCAMLLRGLTVPIGVSRKILRQWRASAKRRRCIADPLAVLHDPCRINNHREREAIQIGRGTHVLATLQTLPHGGAITIGQDAYLGENSYIWSSQSIRIGDRVLISHGVNIHDNISHPISAKARHKHFTGMVSGEDFSQLEGVSSAPIDIGDDAWIGFNATILKGVTIGRGAIVGASTLVTCDVPDWVIVAGNPARIIGQSKK